MRTCWAECIGGCAGGITREHLISESIFAGKEICVNGLPCCRTITVTMLPTNLVSNILCQQHNNDLSPVDKAGLAAFNIFRQALKVQEKRKQYLAAGLASYPFPVAQYEIDGYMFERWLLKTLINYEISGDQNLPIGPPSLGPGRPPTELVEIAFGSKRFQPTAGLYFVGRIGDELHLAERVRYTAWVIDAEGGTYITAGQFLFYNCNFVLNLDPDRSFPNELETQYGVLRTIYRPNGFEIKLNEPSQRITFNW